MHSQVEELETLEDAVAVQITELSKLMTTAGGALSPLRGGSPPPSRARSDESVGMFR